MRWVLNGFIALLLGVFYTASLGSLSASAAPITPNSINVIDKLELSYSGCTIDASLDWSKYLDPEFVNIDSSYIQDLENFRNNFWDTVQNNDKGWGVLGSPSKRGFDIILFDPNTQIILEGDQNGNPKLNFGNNNITFTSIRIENYSCNNGKMNIIQQPGMERYLGLQSIHKTSYDIYFINGDIIYPNDYDGPQIPSTVEPPAPDPIEYPDFFEGGTSGLESCGLLDLSCWRDKLKPAQVIENFTDRISTAWSNLTLPFQLIIDLLKTLANDFKGGTIECGQYGYIGAEHQWHPSVCISEFGPMIGGTGTINIYWGMIEYRLPALWNIGKIIIRTMLAIGLVMGWFRFIQSLANEEDENDG